MALTFSDSSKVRGWLIAGLELQRVIQYRHRYTIPLKELRHIVTLYFNKNHAYYKRVEKDIKKELDTGKETVRRYVEIRDIDAELERLISKKVKEHEEEIDKYDFYDLYYGL